ncbi:MAG: type III pantothenate kinase [Candidatus Omnitrophota bacterium]|jgi:type III pantothenate kinase
MLLAIDIGNTNISFGIFESRKIIKRFDIPTKAFTSGALKKRLSNIKIRDCLISSVVPPVTRKVYNSIKNITGRKAHIIGKDIKVPIKNLYRSPAEVGQDRLVNAYAGVRLYGAPLIVVDFGTAVTFDVISKRKEYLGGMILPGLQLCLEALAQKTALLPEVKLKKPDDFIARDTKNSMLSGIVYGYAALSKSLIKRIKKEMGSRTKVIGTGGNVKIISQFCANIGKIDPYLTLKGINLIYHGEYL